MKELKDYCGIQEGVTHTPTEVVELVIHKIGEFGIKGHVASMFIYPIWDLDYNDNRAEAYCCGYVWKMGKAEYHYRHRMKDKHARRWIKRHTKAVRT